MVTQRALSKSSLVGLAFATTDPEVSCEEVVFWGEGAVWVSSSFAEITDTPLSCLTPSSEGLVVSVELSKRWSETDWKMPSISSPSRLLSKFPHDSICGCSALLQYSSSGSVMDRDC